MQVPGTDNSFQCGHAELLLRSYLQVVGRPLLEGADAEALYHAPFPVLSHNTAADPVLTYGNLAAQALWEMGWEQLTAMPSRLTAEPAHREQRDMMFAEMRAKGFIGDCAGVRISASGRRFEIRGAVIWPLLGPDGVKLGEAASFRDYRFI
ncbi:MEKHLA domain-containing protein [Leisingera sp. SS27]|uniref:MEKHLA domain-containing protein n=1 Tax=Leisingera sp. SS27 TaxID=2979462 RepID=UPI0023315593|nr:MEKHLA domain-containing protein [Leisingera sp. SS27]MDC0656935.1 MEKHLA domain-containing protein [Leisingera sp. SS27]